MTKEYECKNCGKQGMGECCNKTYEITFDISDVIRHIEAKNEEEAVKIAEEMVMDGEIADEVMQNLQSAGIIVEKFNPNGR